MTSFVLDLILVGLRNSDSTVLTPIQNLIQQEFSKYVHCQSAQNQEQAIHYVQSAKRPLMIITTYNPDQPRTDLLVEAIRQHDRRSFLVLYSSEVCLNPDLRWTFAAARVNMITDSVTELRSVIHRIISLIRLDSKGDYTCPYCSWSSLSFEQLYIHVPLYHTNELDLSHKCQICRKSTANYAVHLHEDHQPAHDRRPEATRLYAFALVVCRRKRDGRFLVVQESGSMGYWLPGGRVEVGEQLQQGAIRETLEEAGVKVRLMGILKFEFTPRLEYNRLRVIFYAEPINEDDCEAKTIPDYESYGAMWVTYDQIVRAHQQGQLRSTEPLQWFKYLTENGSIYPLSILS